MTHKYLEDYFHSIINKPTVKEQKTMSFLNLSMFFTEQLENFKKLWTKPTAFVEIEDPKLYENGYWAFEMYTPEWTDEFGDTVKPVHTVLIEPHEGTWMELLDHILDEMEKHYGYNIKEQVYYSVNYPLNEVNERTGLPFAGYGRSLNDELFQQLLLAYPEIYKAVPFGGEAKKGVFE
jgi:hypothetical protein